MAETKKSDGQADARPATKPAAGLAAESGDPTVHQLLAQRQAAEMNGDADLRDAVDRQLVDLGFAEYRH